MFGLNLRAVIPVTFVPTPPRYLALPRWVIWFPKVVFLPVKWQTRGMSQRPFVFHGIRAAKCSRAADLFKKRGSDPRFAATDAARAARPARARGSSAQRSTSPP